MRRALESHGPVIEAALRRLARGGARSEVGAPPRAAEPPARAPLRPPLPPGRSAVIEAALRRLERSLEPRPASRARPATLPRSRSAKPAAAADAPRPAGVERRVPVLTLDPSPRSADPRALAGLLADDVASKLDQLCYVWNVVRELEPFAARGEASIRRRAAELLLVAGGGEVEIPLEGPLRAVRSFLAAHRMEEQYIERLCAWYLNRA